MKFLCCLSLAILAVTAASISKNLRFATVSDEMIKNVANNVDPNTFTISGISAGACMATQVQYAWSSIVKGAGIVAGAPYQCSGGSLSGALECLDVPSMTDVALLEAEVLLNAKVGNIDPLSNLQSQVVYLFSGVIDTVVPQQNMKNVLAMLQAFNVSKITTYFNYWAEHSWITDKYGNSCSSLGSPYINNCGLDFAQQFLNATFHNLNVAWNSTMGTVNLADMYEFSQTKFGANPLTNSLGNNGYIYIPRKCQSNGTVKCHLHMNFHGCTQDKDTLGPLYVLQTEINEWAESNNIIVVYPQATANDLLENPNACFDWWGYAGSSYAQKAGTQIGIFREIVKYFGGF